MFTALFALLFLGPWVWVGFVGLAIFIIIGLERESGFGAFLGLVAGTVLIWALAGAAVPSFSDFFHFLNVNWFGILVAIVAYFALGSAWSIIKWTFYVHKKADELQEEFQKGYQNQDQIDKFWAQWMNPMKNKGKFLVWMTYWPWSALWTLLNDPIRAAFRFIYARLLTTYKAIADHAYNARLKDMKRS